LFVDKSACQEAKRRRLLFLFMKDLTSGVSGEVLSNKSQRDSMSSSSSSRSRIVEGVSLKWKLLAWLFVFLMNFGMLFYVFLFAMTQTHSRQSAWFQSFVMWFVFDVFVSSTGVVLVTHLLIPLYVMSDIRTIKRKVLGDIKAFREKQKQNPTAAHLSPQQQQQFNSAKYLFTSWRVASLFPELPESELILQFSTPWPKRSFKIEKKQVTKTYQRKYSFLIQALSRVLIFFISGLIHFPAVVQDLVIQVGANSGLGYVVLLMLRLYLISPLLPLAPIVALGIVIHFLILSNKNSALLERQGLDAATEPEPEPPLPEKQSSPKPQTQSPESNGEDMKLDESFIEWEESDDEEDMEDVWKEKEKEPQIEWEDDDEEEDGEVESSSEEEKSNMWEGRGSHSCRSSSSGSSLSE
jgi:hypothetical protein